MSNTLPPRRPGPAPRYTREQIFLTALQVIDDGTPDSFSMRRLAEALGVTATALYGYVKDKNELIEGASYIAIAAIHQDPEPDASWQERIRTDMREIHTVMRQHPNLATLVIGQHLKAPSLFRIRERTIGTLLAAGFDETTALHALGALTYYAFGFASGQTGLTYDNHGDPLPDLDPAEFPHLTAIARRYSEHASDQAFDYGLQHLINGLELQLPDAW